MHILCSQGDTGLCRQETHSPRVTETKLICRHVAHISHSIDRIIYLTWSLKMRLKRFTYIELVGKLRDIVRQDTNDEKRSLSPLPPRGKDIK